ncbi:MAG: hypothetical protein ABSH20_18260 [Tepidisphaeraceae bacterium]
MFPSERLVVLAGAGLFTLLCFSRRTRPVAFGVLGVGILVMLYVGIRYTLPQPMRPARIASVPAGFEPAPEQLRHATLYPSITQAATQLTARIADTLGTLPERRHEPARIVVVVPAEIRPAVAAALRTAFPRAQQILETKATTRPAGADDVKFQIEVVAEAPVQGYSPAAARHGTVTAVANGAGGTVEDAVQFIDKPWAADAGAARRQVGRGAIVGRSHTPCTSATEALAQAREAVAAEIRPLVREHLSSLGRSSIELDEPWFTRRVNAAVSSSRFAQDDFVQEMTMPYGSVFRGSVLVSTAPDKIGFFCNQLLAERNQRATHTLSTAAAVGALSLLIVLVYLFLNTVTRGYFTLRLRLAAVGLIAAAVLLVIMVS